jgi:hypothetical protein
MIYIQLSASGKPPDISAQRPFKGIVVAEAPVTSERQAAISQWLVESGCLYMMTWGEGCSSWNDAVNLANLGMYNFGEIPDDHLVITTCHENEPLKEVFWFAKHTAMHPCFALDNVVLLHLSPVARAQELTDEYTGA